MTTRLISPILQLREPEFGDEDKIVEYLIKNKSDVQKFEPVRPKAYYIKTYWREKIITRQMQKSEQKGVLLFILLNKNPNVGEVPAKILTDA